MGLRSIINLRGKVAEQFNIATDIDPGPANLTKSFNKFKLISWNNLTN